MQPTLLDLYCKFAHWQGGTIHEAVEDFMRRPRNEQDAFCSEVFNHGTDKLSLYDLQQFQRFTRARLGD